MDGSWSVTGRLTNAVLVLPDRVITGSLGIENGVITEIGPGDAPGLDLSGDILMPGIVDIHTDHVEKHVFPRTSVQWDFLNAFMAHDAQMIGSGVTTVFDSLSVGASMRRPERREILDALIDAMEAGQARGLFRADHLLHMRCEICDPTTVELVDRNIGRAISRVVSVMDHTPGDRQSPDVAAWTRELSVDMGVTLPEAEAMTQELLDRSARVGAGVRAHVVAAALRAGLPLMSHDDATPAHVAEALAEGTGISEFPTTLAAARAARAGGMTIVAGAPNYLRGGSQSGNVAVRDLLAEGLVDILASDYVPRSLIDAAFAIAGDAGLGYDLPRALRLVTLAPARAGGLTDRGDIAPGQRADLLRVRRQDGRTHLRAIWRVGQRVA